MLAAGPGPGPGGGAGALPPPVSERGSKTSSRDPGHCEPLLPSAVTDPAPLPPSHQPTVPRRPGVNHGYHSDSLLPRPTRRPADLDRDRDLEPSPSVSSERARPSGQAAAHRRPSVYQSLVEADDISAEQVDIVVSIVYTQFEKL